MMLDDKSTLKRCVIYTRKSTDEGLDKEYNTLEAQWDACASHIRAMAGMGWQLVDRHYDDGGYSGGNMDRPALKVLLRDVAAHKVDVVVVYKLDRISRSLADFTELSRLFNQHNVSLVSVTQQIDTSSSMGRMIINLLMSFAQFEREMTSDRLKDKFAAQRRKGMWTGGVTPYGYTFKDSRLYANPVEAPRALYAFEQYAECQSFLEVSRRLNEKFGEWRNGKKWNVEHVRHMLVQAVFAGKIRDPHSGELYDGRHEAIVPFELWSRVQQFINEKRRGKFTRRTESTAPLKGVLRCGHCSGAMVPTYCTKNGKHTFTYYRCEKYHKRVTEGCPIRNISSSAIEAPVFNLIERMITSEYFIQLVAEDPEQIELLRQIGKHKAQFIQMMTTTERRRLIELFVRKVEVRADGIQVVVRGDCFKNLMGRERVAAYDPALDGPKDESKGISE